MYNFIDKTLTEAQKGSLANLDGYAVFVLQDEDDMFGKPLDENFSIGLILRKHPEYADCKVKYVNDFYGTTVLRVVKTDKKDSTLIEKAKKSLETNVGFYGRSKSVKKK